MSEATEIDALRRRVTVLEDRMQGLLDLAKCDAAWAADRPAKPHGVRPALQPKPLGDVDHTVRGFEVIRFRDDAADDCTLQQSSAMADGREPGQSFVWLGVKDDRMHLSRRTVASLVAHLRSWLKRGTFTLEETK